MFSMADGFRRLRELNTLHNADRASAACPDLHAGAQLRSMAQQSRALSQSMHDNAMTSMQSAQQQGHSPTGFSGGLNGGIGIGF